MKRASLLACLALAASPGACRLPAIRGPESAAKIGQPAPEVELVWLDGGGSCSLADLSGSVVLLEFWRTWCEPSLAEVAYLDELHERYADDGLAIVAVTTEGEQAVRAAVQRAGVRYPVALAPEGSAEVTYGITAVPRAFLIDREGVLVWVGHPGALEEGRVRELLFER